MEPLLKITNLYKEYEKVIAVNDISLEIAHGSIFGLLGPNGAGKTSLIRMLTGITIPDKGNFTLKLTENSDFDTLSRMIGYLPEERGLYPDMKISEQLEFLGRIKGLSKKEVKEKMMEYSEKLGITDWLEKKAQELSKGMQQMVQFVATIFYEPDLIILDEPFTGLDPINSNKMTQIIKDLQANSKTIIFSTHRLEQVEDICENIALINKGKIILEGSIRDIKHRFKKNIFQVDYIGTPQISSISDIEVLSSDQNKILLHDISASPNANALLRRLLDHIEIVSFIEILPSLSEIFIDCVNITATETDSDDITVPIQSTTGDSHE
jgi:ABC-2 type transport system ATP-binding protein